MRRYYFVTKPRLTQPWSVLAQGEQIVSHQCVKMNLEVEKVWLSRECNARLSLVRRSAAAVGIVFVIIFVVIVIIVVIIVLLVVLMAVISATATSAAPARCLLLLGGRSVVARQCVVILRIVLCLIVPGATTPGLTFMAPGDDMPH